MDFNLAVAKGEFIAFLGPSGCGKTTTLRMVAGLEEITSGEIRIGAQVVNDLPPKERDIAMVFQNYALYPHKTVFDNMAFGLQMRSYAKDEILKRVRDAAGDLGLVRLAQLQREAHVLAHGHVRVQGVVLEHHRDVAVFRFHVVHDAITDAQIT